jgi:DNA polymerase delta subunit 1
MLVSEWCEEENSTNDDGTICRYLRPVNPLLNESDSLRFQWIDIDMTSGLALESNPSGGDIIGIKVGIVPIIRLYGVTKEGYSVAALVHGFVPYFYVGFPENSNNITPSNLADLRNYLDQRVRYLVEK